MARLCNRRWCWPEWRWNACWCGNSLWLLTPGRAHGCDWSNAWGGCWRCGGGCRGNRVGLTLSCCNCEFSLWWWLLMVVTMALRWAIYGTWMGYLWHLELVNLMVARDLGTRNVTLYFFWTRIIRITRMFFGTRISQISRILSSWCLNTNFTLTDFEPSARCEWQLVTVIGSLWLLTCYVLNDKSKKISVSHAKHWQIREICEIRVHKNIRVIRKIRVQNDEWFKMMSGSRW